MSVSARLLALDALVRVEDGAYAHVLLPAMLRGSRLRDRDRAFATDLVYGTVRAQRRLDDLLARVSSRPVRRLDPPVRAALRLGAYQLVSGVSPHAAVSETVDALAARSPRARGFANAVLRALARLGPPWPEAASEAVALSYPDWLVGRLDLDLGTGDARAALAAMNAAPPVTLRTRAPDAIEGELRDAGAAVERGRLVPDALVVRGAGDPAALAAVREGRATPQDQASQAVAGLLGARAGDRVADVAAAPGGKATALAERVGADGLVVAVDLDAGRLRLVRDASERLGLANLHAVVADARALPLRGGEFDRVLLDAPCSGLGVLHRRPDARWRVTEASVGELAALQRELLLAAAPLVRAGGRLVYSVCTLTRAETVEIDEWAASCLHEFVAATPPGTPWHPLGRGALLLPQAAGTDGMYALLLDRTRGADTVSP
ncbi:MAG TPA: transcription antitermination factor NusB [Acidimicrobiia bacterium]|nr:transcription antitermination factor NusB [Acidimicrobiia bacterium]